MADRGLAAFGRGGADILERKTSELGKFLLDRDRMAEKRRVLEADPATQLTKIELGEKRARVEREKAPVSWTEFESGLVGYAPRTQKMLVDLVKNLGIFDETGMTTAGDMNRAMTRLMGKPGTLLAIAKSETGHYQDIYNDAKYTYEELKKNNKADTPQGRKALDALNSATQDLSNISKAASALITKSTEYEQEREEETRKRKQAEADDIREQEQALERIRVTAEEARKTAGEKPKPTLTEKLEFEKMKKGIITDEKMAQINSKIAEDVEDRGVAGWVTLYNKNSEIDQWKWVKKGIKKFGPDADGWVKVPKGGAKAGKGGEPKVIVRRGTYMGRKIVQYEDGTTDYVD